MTELMSLHHERERHSDDYLATTMRDRQPRSAPLDPSGPGDSSSSTAPTFVAVEAMEVFFTPRLRYLTASS